MWDEKNIPSMPIFYRMVQEQVIQLILIFPTTGLPAYSDTGYSDIPATVTVFWSIKGSPHTENPGYSDIPHPVTLFGRPNTVTLSGEACIPSAPCTT